MSNPAELPTFWTFLDNITNNLKSQRLADVFVLFPFILLKRMVPINIYVLKSIM